MAIRFDEWLERTGRPRNKASADLWKRTHGVALGLYNRDGTPAERPSVTPAPEPAPTPDPYLTPEGFGAAANPDAQAAIADLLAEYQGTTGGTIDASGNFVAGPTSGTIGSQYNQTINALAARRPAIEQARRDRLSDITSEMAGRGLLRSGIRQVENTRANADAYQSLNEVERGIQQAGTDRGVALSEATARLLRGRQDIENRANAGYIGTRIGDFQNSYGGAPQTAPAPLVEPSSPEPPRSSHILARWDKKPTYSSDTLQRRFGDGRLAKTGKGGYVYTNRKRAR